MEPLLSNRIYNLPEPEWSGEAPFVSVDTFAEQHEDRHPIYDLGESWRYDRAFVASEDLAECEITQEAWDMAEENPYEHQGHRRNVALVTTETGPALREIDEHSYIELVRLGAAPRGKHGMNKQMAWNIANSAKEDIARCSNLDILERKWETAVDMLWTVPGTVDLEPMISLLTDTLNARVARLEKRKAINAQRRERFNKWQADQAIKAEQRQRQEEEQRLLEIVIARKGTHMIRVSRKVYLETWANQGYVVKQ